MYHRRSRLRLNDKPDHARLLLKNLVTSLILYESIRTTRKRAKVMQPIIDGLITMAKKKQPNQAIRAINPQVADRNASRKLMEVLRERFADRSSGFTRIKADGARKGDGAQLVDISFVEGKAVAAKPAAEKPAKEKKAKPAAKKSTAKSDSTPSA